MKLKAKPTVEKQRLTEIAMICKSSMKAEQLMSIWNCSTNRDVFIDRAKERGYPEEAITLFLKP